MRVGSVYFIYAIYRANGYSPTISFAVVGLVIGEGASMLVSLTAIYCRFYSLSASKQLISQIKMPVSSFRQNAGRLLSLAVPLSLNRTLINFLQSIEAIYIPQCLLRYGYDNAKALSVYGVLTGMALPLILFPSAITNSISLRTGRQLYPHAQLYLPLPVYCQHLKQHFKRTRQNSANFRL